MEQKNIEASVVSIISAVLKSDVNLESTRLNTDTWDSLKHIEIIFAVEDELGVQFAEEELPVLDSVKKIVEMAKVYYAP